MEIKHGDDAQHSTALPERIDDLRQIPARDLADSCVFELGVGDGADAGGDDGGAVVEDGGRAEGCEVRVVFGGGGGYYAQAGEVGELDEPLADGCCARPDEELQYEDERSTPDLKMRNVSVPRWKSLLGSRESGGQTGSATASGRQ